MAASGKGSQYEAHSFSIEMICWLSFCSTAPSCFWEPESTVVGWREVVAGQDVVTGSEEMPCHPHAVLKKTWRFRLRPYTCEENVSCRFLISLHTMRLLFETSGLAPSRLLIDCETVLGVRTIKAWLHWARREEAKLSNEKGKKLFPNTPHKLCLIAAL